MTFGGEGGGEANLESRVERAVGKGSVSGGGGGSVVIQHGEGKEGMSRLDVRESFERGGKKKEEFQIADNCGEGKRAIGGCFGGRSCFRERPS